MSFGTLFVMRLATVHTRDGSKGKAREAEGIFSDLPASCYRGIDHAEGLRLVDVVALRGRAAPAVGRRAVDLLG